MSPWIFATAWVIVVAGAGGWITKLDAWYDDLDRPPWQPPDWLFGPAWTTIFLTAGAACVLAWRAAPDAAAAIITVYVVNGALNMLWSALFFRLHRPDWALLETVALWLSIIAMIVVLRPHASITTWLLLPYILWVSFAFVLNAEIVRRNRPF